MPINLPTDLLRSFLAIVDTGSMMRATDHVFLSPSALSLQMKRLEEIARRQLFQRSGRSLMLTPAGRELAAVARKMLDLNDAAVGSLLGETLSGQVQIGMVQDFAETLLPEILRDFSALHPQTQLRLQVAGSPELVDAYSRSALDIALGLGRPSDPHVLQVAPMIWLGDAELAEAEEVKLVLLEAPCVFRTACLRALQDAGRRFRIVLETPSLSGMRAAVAAGLGVTCRTDLVAGWGGLPVVPPARLPKLPEVGYVLLHSEDPTEAGRRLAELTEGALRRRGTSPPSIKAITGSDGDSLGARRLAKTLSAGKGAVEEIQRHKIRAVC
jgi:DNA-binding transcriptional LysR family regulator